MRAFEYHAETFVNIRDGIFFVSHCNGTILSLNDNKHYVYYRQGKIKGSDCKSEPAQGSEGVTKEEWKFPKLSMVSVRSNICLFLRAKVPSGELPVHPGSSRERRLSNQGS